MKAHINGWPLLERYLRLQGRTQSDLARLLQVTPSAISQFKNGRSQCGTEQLRVLVHGLRMSSADTEIFYSLIFQARILGTADAPFHVRRAEGGLGDEGYSIEVPILKEEAMLFFRPALEHCSAFIRQHSTERLSCGVSGVSAAVRFEELRRPFRLPAHCFLLIDCVRYPEEGDLVYFRLRERSPLIAYCRFKEGGLELDPREFGGNVFRIEEQSDFSLLSWAFPVRGILVDSRYVKS